MSNDLVHKLVLKRSGAATACKKDIIALYPMTWYALGSEAGALQFRVTLTNRDSTCKECKARMKEDETDE